MPPLDALHGRHDGTSLPRHRPGGNADSGGSWSASVALAAPHHQHIGPDASSACAARR